MDLCKRLAALLLLIPCAAAGCASDDVRDFTVEDRRGFIVSEGQESRLPGGRWVRHGEWIERHGNGETAVEGEYRLGLRTGIWRRFDEDGNPIEEVAWEEDRRNGPAVEYWPSGEKRSEGEYRDGIRNGVWIFWYENGNRASEGDYRDGQRYGTWNFWREDGSVDEAFSGRYDGNMKVRAPAGP